jgi:diphthine-ammonia ligase
MDIATDSWKGKGFFCAWSGGKDCSFALYRAIMRGAVTKVLLTMCSLDGLRTLTHDLPIHVVQSQADALGIPLVKQPSTWATYEASFREAVEALSTQGVDAGLTGDTEFGKRWLETICRDYAMDAWMPLWEVDPEETFRELLELGFKAVVVAASDSKVGRELAGRTLDLGMVEEFRRKHVDILGEYNEYHTFVTDGPIFRHPVGIRLADLKLVNGYWIQSIDVT